jgi:transposase
LQFAFALWTRAMVRELIRREFGVRLWEVSVGRLLRKLGLSPQRLHRSKAVKAFAASTNGRLRLCFLPGYAPELNPDE